MSATLVPSARLRGGRAHDASCFGKPASSPLGFFLKPVTPRSPEVPPGHLQPWAMPAVHVSLRRILKWVGGDLEGGAPGWHP